MGVPVVLVYLGFLGATEMKDRGERQGLQLPILLAAESCVSNGLTFMTAVGKQEFDLPGDALIEEQSHFKVAVRLVLASSIAAMASALVTLGKSSRNSDSVRPCSR